MVTKGRTDTLVTVVEALALIAAADDGIVSSDRIGEAMGLHPVVVRRLLAPMRSAGFVEARRGISGGWAIARDPASIRLGDIYRVLGQSQTAALGAVGAVVYRAETAFLAELDRSTLADIMP